MIELYFTFIYNVFYIFFNKKKQKYTEAYNIHIIKSDFKSYLNKIMPNHGEKRE